MSKGRLGRGLGAFLLLTAMALGTAHAQDQAPAAPASESTPAAAAPGGTTGTAPAGETAPAAPAPEGTTPESTGETSATNGTNGAAAQTQGASGETAADEGAAPDDEAVDDNTVLLAPERMPLAPAPTSSPRRTFESFRTLTQDAARALMNAFHQSENDDAIFDTSEIRALKRRALDQLVRAASTLDLSAIAPANRRTVGLSAVLMLEEVLERIPLPPLDEIPGDAQVEAGAAKNGWTLPGTEIRMSRVESESGEQRFLFSTETVQRLPTFYDLVEELPHRDGIDVDFYQHFVSAPGLSMPTEIYRYVIGFPDWLLETYMEQAVWQWIALGLLVVIVVAAILLILRWESRRSEAETALGRSIRRMFAPILIIAALALFERAADDVINLTGDVQADLELLVESLQTIAFAVIAWLGFNLLAALIVSSPRIRPESLDASLIRLLFRVVGFAVAGYIIFLGATRVGLPAYGIVAGLGVGGLAIALAVRPTLENFIGGIILYADRPVKVGDFCKFGDMLGTVEEIGLRSTKVRGLDRTLVIVQNAEFAQMSITNFTRRDYNLMNPTFGLRYETDETLLAEIIERIANMLRADPRVDSNTVRVAFRGFGTYALNVEIWCYVRSADWGRFLKIQEELFMKVMTIVRESGSAFAIPAQTTYLGTDRLPGSDVEETRPELAVTLTREQRPADEGA